MLFLATRSLVPQPDTVKSILLALVAKTREGATPGFVSPPLPAGALGALGVPPPRKQIAAPPGADAAALAAFDAVLAHVDALAHLSGGLFTGGGKFGGGGGGDGVAADAQMASAAGGAITSASASSAPAGELTLSASPPSPTSASLRALRETLHAAGATDAVAALLQVSVAGVRASGAHLYSFRMMCNPHLTHRALFARPPTLPLQIRLSSRMGA